MSVVVGILECPGCGRSRPLTREGLAGIRKGRNSGFCRTCARRRRPVLSFESRFWARVDKTGGCWLWAGATNSNGYGQIRRGATSVLAHRASWEIHRGPIPDGMHVLHTCDTPPCVNPEHLWLGDAKANADDRDAKGRGWWQK